MLSRVHTDKTRIALSWFFTAMTIALMALAPQTQARTFDDEETRVLQAYLAYYGRPGDPGGLEYWSNRLRDEGGDINSIINAFGESEEYQSRFGGLSNIELVSNLYQQLFGRAPDQGGLDFYVGKLESGEWNLQKISLVILDGVQGDDISIIDNRIAFSKRYVEADETGEITPLDAESLAGLIGDIDADAGSVDRVYADLEAYGNLVSGFGDPAFASCVRTAALANNWTSLSQITELDCSGLEVRSLSGVRDLVNLEALNTSGTLIKDVRELTALANLTELDLSDITTLTAVDLLAAIPSLESLDLRGTGGGNLSCAAVADVARSVTTLSDPDNCLLEIAQVSFSDNALRSCVEDAASALDLEYTNELTTLSCAGSDIYDLDGIDALQQLRSLNLQDTAVTALSALASLDDLETLNIANTQVTSVAVLRNLISLQVLDASGLEGLTDISSLDSMSSLTQISLYGSGAGGLSCDDLDTLGERLNTRPACALRVVDVVIPDAALKQCVDEYFEEWVSRGDADQDTLAKDWANNNSFSCRDRGIRSLEGLQAFRFIAIELRGNQISDPSPLGEMSTLLSVELDNNALTSTRGFSQLEELIGVYLRDNPDLSDVDSLLYMKNIKNLSLTGSATGAKLTCSTLDALEAQVERDDFGGDQSILPVFEPPSSCNDLSGGSQGEVASDVNGDDKANIIVDRGSEYRILSQVDGRLDTLAESSQLVEPSRPSSAYKFLAMADANNDGLANPLVRLSDGQQVSWAVLDRSGNVFLQAFWDGADGTGEVDDDVRAVGFKDLNNDGYADILLRAQGNLGSEGTVYFYIAHGGSDRRGGFEVPQRISSLNTGTTASSLAVLAIDDVNDDDFADIVLEIASNTDNQRCFTVWLNTEGEFPRGIQITARDYCISASLLSRVAGVGDIDGDGRSELIMQDIGPTGAPFWRAHYMVDGLPCTSGCSLRPYVNGWGPYRTIAQFKGVDGALTPVDPVAVKDVNNDGRADIVFEIRFDQSIRWYALISEDYGSARIEEWLVTDELSTETLGMRDFTGDGLPDLMLRWNGPLYANVGKDRAAEILLHGNVDGERFGEDLLYAEAASGGGSKPVIGLEEGGLTVNAGNIDALINWDGSDQLFTMNTFKAKMAAKQFEGSSSGLALITPDQMEQQGGVLRKNQCAMVASADAGYEGLLRGAKAKFEVGALVCNSYYGDRVSIKTQLVHVGCDAVIDVVGKGAECKAAVYRGNLKLALADGATQEITSQFASANACGGTSISKTCAGASAQLLKSEVKLQLAGVGAKPGITLVGVGAGAGIGLSNGVLSGSVKLAFLVGVSIEFSIDFEKTGRFFYNAGKYGYVAVNEAGKLTILAAGEAVKLTGVVISESARFVGNASVYLAENVADTAVIIFEDIGAPMADIFVDIADGLLGAVGGAILDIAGGVGEFFSSIF